MEGNWSRLLSLLLLLLSPTAFAAGVADTLGKDGNITGDGTLVSANGTFTMGFFSLGPSANKRYYLGIWFSVSPDAVCWVANRDRPIINDNTGALVLGDTGGLLLRDGSGQVAWSSNSTVVSSSSVEAQLLETGNLVVRDRGSGNVLLWQSFDHPSNTMLSGMKVGKNLWDGAEWQLTSWISADDPAPGPYRLVLDTSGLPDLVLLQGNVTKYREGPWNGESFSGATEALGYRQDLITLTVTNSSGEISYGYTSKPGAPWTRLVVMDHGKVNRVVWDNSSRGWTLPIFQGPRDPCDDYGKCGAFGVCDPNSVATSFCRCLRGFSHASPSAWNQDTLAACRRDVKLQCSSDGGTTDGFVLVKEVKLPDTHNASVDMGITMKECKRRCLADCSCLAYAAADIRGGGVPSGCVIWTDNIMDLRYVDHGQDLYLRLAKSELDKDFPLKAVVAPVASTVVVLALFLLIW